MGSTRPPETDERADPAVTGWRLCLLTEAGLTQREALPIAADPAVDVHKFIAEYQRLREHGCGKRLALRILRPLPSRHA